MKTVAIDVATAVAVASTTNHRRDRECRAWTASAPTTPNPYGVSP
jgi:hypothetical protein